MMEKELFHCSSQEEYSAGLQEMFQQDAYVG